MNDKLIFQSNAFYKKLLKLRETDRKTFDSLSQPTHWALLEYERAKRAAAELEAMRNELPPAA